MAQILGTKARILKAVAFPTCWCPQLLGCCAEQFTLLEISTAFCGTNAKIYIWKGREGVKERLKLKTPKIKNKREKDPQTKKRSKWKIREIFLLLEKVFHHLICLASVQTFILHSGSCGFLVLCPSPGVLCPATGLPGQGCVTVQVLAGQENERVSSREWAVLWWQLSVWETGSVPSCTLQALIPPLREVIPGA